MGKLEGKVAIITGGARGNGEGAARVMAREGAVVVLVDVLDEVEETARSIVADGYKSVSFQADITDAAAVNRIVQQVIEQFGKVDILVNNAGVARGGPLVSLADEVRDYVFDVNIKGPFICAKAVLPNMIERKYGKIINVSSVTGPMVANPNGTVYAATKGALWGFTRALAVEVAPNGINVNAICPGWIDTSMFQNMIRRRYPEDPQAGREQFESTIPWGRAGTIEEFGELAAFLASDESRYITGASIVLDGGSTLPESLDYRSRA